MRVNELLKPTQVINQLIASQRLVQDLLPKVPDHFSGIDQSGYKNTYLTDGSNDVVASESNLVWQINIGVPNSLVTTYIYPATVVSCIIDNTRLLIAYRLGNCNDRLFSGICG